MARRNIFNIFNIFCVYVVVTGYLALFGLPFGSDPEESEYGMPELKGCGIEDTQAIFLTSGVYEFDNNPQDDITAFEMIEQGNKRVLPVGMRFNAIDIETKRTLAEFEVPCVTPFYIMYEREKEESQNVSQNVPGYEDKEVGVFDLGDLLN